jgi:hypothetical protein
MRKIKKNVLEGGKNTRQIEGYKAKSREGKK